MQIEDESLMWDEKQNKLVVACLYRDAKFSYKVLYRSMTKVDGKLVSIGIIFANPVPWRQLRMIKNSIDMEALRELIYNSRYYHIYNLRNTKEFKKLYNTVAVANEFSQAADDWRADWDALFGIGLGYYSKSILDRAIQKGKYLHKLLRLGVK
jgi:hypothetical protein